MVEAGVAACSAWAKIRAHVANKKILMAFIFHSFDEKIRSNFFDVTSVFF